MATPVKYRNGLTGTIIFHVALLFILLFMAFRTPLPLPEEQGILVDFGNSRTGMGAREPRHTEAAPVVQEQRTTTQPKPTQNKEPILTQDNEEAVAVPEQKKTKKETPVEKPKEQAKPAETPKPVEQPKPERKPDARALYPGHGTGNSTTAGSGSGDSQGEAGGSGNQGSPGGQVGVHVYGDGSGWGLSGRSLQGSLPKPVYNSNEQGKVVVEITVDKEGNVIEAKAGAKGSTTLDPTLLDAARKAAVRARFNRKADAPVQKGTITYIFKLQGE